MLNMHFSGFLPMLVRPIIPLYCLILVIYTVSPKKRTTCDLP